MLFKWKIIKVGEVEMKDYTNKDWEQKSFEQQKIVVHYESDTIQFEVSGKNAWIVREWDEVAVTYNAVFRSGISKRTEKPYEMNSIKVTNLEVYNKSDDSDSDLPF